MTRRRPPAFAVSPALFAAALTLSACQPRAEAPPAPEAPAAAGSLETALTQTAAPPEPAVQTQTAPPSEIQSPAPAAMAASRPAEPEARLPEGPNMAPRRVPLEPSGCRAEIGEAASARLVQRCIRVSPATHPPCNAANPCEMIQEEIDRGCAMWTETDQPLPKECAA